MPRPLIIAVPSDERASEEGKRAQDKLDQLKKVLEDEAKKKVQDTTTGADSPATEGSCVFTPPNLNPFV